MSKAFYIAERLAVHYEEIKPKIPNGYQFFGLFLQGIQNYNLDDKNSTVTSICLIVPTLKTLITKNRDRDKSDNQCHIIYNPTIDGKDFCYVLDIKTFLNDAITLPSLTGTMEVLATKYYLYSIQYERQVNIMRSFGAKDIMQNPYICRRLIISSLRRNQIALGAIVPYNLDVNNNNNKKRLLESLVYCAFIKQIISQQPIDKILSLEEEYLIKANEIKNCVNDTKVKSYIRDLTEEVEAMAEHYINDLSDKIKRAKNDVYEQIEDKCCQLLLDIILPTKEDNK